MTTSAQRVADRYLYRLASREVCASSSFRTRTATLHDLTPRVLEAFAEGFSLHEGRVASFGGLVKKLGDLIEFFKKAPKVWGTIKQFLGVKDMTDLPKAIKDWAKQGLTAFKNVIFQATKRIPLALYFVSEKKMPGLTDLMKRILNSNPALAKALEKVRNFGERLDVMFDKYLPVMKKPLLAAIFIFIWWNSGIELTWDFPELVKGFTGNYSIGALFMGTPEVIISLVVSTTGLGFWSLPITVLARLLWLLAQDYLEWSSSKRGFVVKWDAITGSPRAPEFVPVF